MKGQRALGLAVAIAAIHHVVVFASPGDVVARQAIQVFAGSQWEGGIALMAPKALPEDPPAVLGGAHTLLAGLGTPLQINRVYRSFSKSLKEDRQRESSTYHVLGPRGAALIMATSETTAGKTLLTQFRWEPAPTNLMDRFPLVLSGVSLPHYVLALAALAVLVTVLTALVLWVRRPVARRWLWLPFILVGFGRVGLYWLPGPFQSGMLRLVPVHVSLFGVGLVKYPLYDPWLLAVSFPLGAAIFLYRYGRARRTPPADLSAAS